MYFYCILQSEAHYADHRDSTSTTASPPTGELNNLDMMVSELNIIVGDTVC